MVKQEETSLPMNPVQTIYTGILTELNYHRFRKDQCSETGLFWKTQMSDLLQDLE